MGVPGHVFANAPTVVHYGDCNHSKKHSILQEYCTYRFSSAPVRDFKWEHLMSAGSWEESKGASPESA